MFAKILRSPINLFQKNCISFLVIRRYDLNSTIDLLRYVSVKPNASISNLRQKLWHLLDLPDYCDEIIILRTNNGVEIPLIELRRGNKPENPFILEVWCPNDQKGKLVDLQDIDDKKYLNLEATLQFFYNGTEVTRTLGYTGDLGFPKQVFRNLYRLLDEHSEHTHMSMLAVSTCDSTSAHNKMLTFGSSDEKAGCEITTAEESMEAVVNIASEDKDKYLSERPHGFKDVNSEPCDNIHSSFSSISRLSKLCDLNNKVYDRTNFIDGFNKSELSCKISSSSIRFKLPPRKGNNFTNMLLKIQNDLNVLHNKIGALETRIPT